MDGMLADQLMALIAIFTRKKNERILLPSNSFCSEVVLEEPYYTFSSEEAYTHALLFTNDRATLKTAQPGKSPTFSRALRANIIPGFSRGYDESSISGFVCHFDLL